MPRLTNADFYEHYCGLYYLLQRFPLMFEMVSKDEGRMLFAYFGVTNQMTKEQSLVHRGIMDKQDPGLAAKAGKLYNRMYRVFEEVIKDTKGDMNQFNRNLLMYMQTNNILPSRYEDSTKRPPIKHKKISKVSVRAERREEVDWDKYAYTLLQYTKGLTEKQRKAEAAPAPAPAPKPGVPAASPTLPPAKPGQQALL